jgi:predicted TIM-barrel fold metal-dependent hydrolase
VSEPSAIIDVNVSLGHWPLRRVPCDEPAALVAKLRAHNVTEAWAGSYDGLFHDDLTSVNNRLAQNCSSITDTSLRLLPFGEINPLAANWEAELNRCVETHRMPGIRLHPNFHGYTLAEPNFIRLLKAAAKRSIIVQLTVLMEDVRMQHALLRVPPVDLAPLPAVAQTPNVKLVLLNALPSASRGDKLYRLTNTGNIYVEIAMLEGVGGIENILKDVPLDKILFGSHAPSLYFESAVLKLQESQLPARHVNAIKHENARRLLLPSPSGRGPG